MSDRYEAINAAGGRVVCVTVDSPQQNAAMVEKLQLPFPMLSDPDRTKAIEPYGVADSRDPREIARPAIFVITPEKEVAFSEVSRDFADRRSEERVLGVLSELDLPPTTPEPMSVGLAEPGPRAMPLNAMEPYFRGAKFAVTAMKTRHPDIADDASDFIDQVDRFIDVAKELRPETG